MEVGELKSLIRDNLQVIAGIRTKITDRLRKQALEEISDLVSVTDIYFTHLSTCLDLSHLPCILLDSYLQHTLKLLQHLCEVLDALPGARAREHVIVSTSKLRVLVEGWEGLSRTPMDDLLALPKDHPRWHHLRHHTELHHPKDPINLRLVTEDMYKTAIWAHAFVSQGLSYLDTTIRRIMTGFYVFYYSLNSHKAYHQARLNFAKPKPGSLVALARCEDSVLLKLFERSPYKLQTHQVFFLSRCSSHLTIDSDPEETIPIRILSTSSLPLSKSSRPGLGCETDSVKVVLHCHGGGFVSMSSGGHLPYTAKWAVDSPGCVVISVDYRLAPEHPYPAGLNDVQQVYTWITTHMQEDLGLSPSKIIFGGDSAGAHILLGCLIKSIQANSRLPDGLMLAYPALILDSLHFTPSLCLSLDDMVLSYAFLKVCLTSYIQDPSLDTGTDIILSPGYADIEILRKFPPTRIVVGTLDPLGDDCLRFTERLLTAKVDVRLAVFEGVAHGGMNHMIKSEHEDVRALSMRAAGFISELLGN